ncbi:ankyrin repeat domain containing protein 24 [Dermatophagoides farinae]|uniref:Ankyrin repeat domain containing protein 24 n=1 Tax=Dermatophagoides farinae TaxID=6954 RepID=A0A9D4P3D7_DERFA|nr:protein phosphatase 1 regulatory subunit 16A-like [Dermatophagoides farinae]KAH7642320.1 ankyrin repeat domain containing protein 24 [Dermatophagoides farinae]
MAEHSDLISEMAYLEKLNTEERLKLARKRRSQQLKKWSQREKDYTYMNKRKRADGSQTDTAKVKNNNNNNNKNGYKVHFVPSVMLLEAATRNDIYEVRRLLMLGVSPDSTNEDGLTALHQCCIDNCEEMMRLLIEFKANVNAKDSEQWTPLHAAATCGHLNLIKLLIENDADLLAVNADGNMPYDICEDEQTLDYIEAEMAKRGITQELIDQIRVKTENQMLFDMKELVQNGYDIDLKDEQGATPLHIAAANGYMSVIEFLVDNNASIDECDNDLWQPIHAAACWGHIDVVEFLVQNGADLEAKTKNGETPFDICEDPDLKNRILQLKTEIDAKKAINSTRLRRSHSTNTRSHSIRRTSIREKSQIAKREAIEEARIWHEKAGESDDIKKDDSDLDSDTQFYKDFNRKLITESPIDIDSIKVNMDSNNIFHISSPSSFQSENGNHDLINNTSNYSKPQPDTGTYNNDHHQQVGSSHQYDLNISNEPQDNQYPNIEYTPQNRKFDRMDGNDSHQCSKNHDSYHPDLSGYSINNNNTGTGTLIDLKKQRSEKHRNSLNNIYSDRYKSFAIDHPSNTNIQSIIPTNQTTINHHMKPTTTKLYGQNVNLQLKTQMGNVSSLNNTKTPFSMTTNDSMFDSPDAARKKFRGNPSELIGEEEKKGCCNIC